MATPAQRTNTWILDQWYDQAVAGTQGLEGLLPTIEFWGWGFNQQGQLGQNNLTEYSSPVQIPGGSWDASRFQTAAPGNDNGQLNAGVQCGLMTKNDGTLWYIGGTDFNYGTSGLDNTNEYSSPTQVGTDTTWTKPVGTLATLARKTDGTLWSWGRNDYGQLAQNNQTNLSSPKQVGTDNTWNYVNSFGIVSVGTKTDGSAWFWGDNEKGCFGNNSEGEKRSSPIQIGSTGDWSNHNGFALSRSVMSGAIKSNGTLWTWGQNNNGQLGDNSTTSRSSPTQVGTDTSWKGFIWLSDEAAAGLKTDGTLWAWGGNASGKLGQNQPGPTQYSSPKQVGTKTDWSRIGNMGNNAVGAINSSKELWVFGGNGPGNLGLNDRANRSAPIQVPGTWYGVSNSYTGFGDNCFGAKLP